MVDANFKGGVWLRVWAAIRKRATAAAGGSIDVEVEGASMTARLVKIGWKMTAAKKLVAAALTQ